MRRDLLREWIKRNAPRGIEKLANECDITVSAVNRILGGGTPGLDTAKSFSKLLNISIEELTEDEPKPKKRAS